MKVGFKRLRNTVRIVALGVASAYLLSGTANAAELKVMISGGFSATYRSLVPQFEQATGHKILTTSGPSMGSAADSIPARIQRGEPADVFIMVAGALDNLIKDGKAITGSRIDLARSGIGIAVRAGSPKPDVGSVEALKRTLLAARSVAISDGPAGAYLSGELFPRLGTADQMKTKTKRVESGMPAAVVARGDAEIGFQQISELLGLKGIDYVGPLPAEVQRVTVLSAGLAVGAKEIGAAKALIALLSSPFAIPAIARSGLEPMGPKVQAN
jgi:molybdate transport system substrate-binding protein